MEVSDSSYKLDYKEFDQALFVLKEEQKVDPLSRLNKISYLLLNISAYGSLITFIIFLIISISVGLPEKGVWFTVLLILFVSWLILTTLTPIIFLLNLPLVKKIRQHIKLSREIGLLKLVNDQWLALRKRRRFLNVLTSIAAIIGLLIMIGGVSVGFALYELTGGILGLIFSSFVGGAIIATHFIRRGKERLDILTKVLLLSKEAAQQTKANQIDVPIKEYELIAQIERAQISRSRQQSILTSLEEAESLEYFVQKSYSVKQVLSQLDQNERSLVEDRIDDLISEPKPSEAKKDTESELYWLSLSEPAVKICYQVDEDSHRIKILSINKLDSKSLSNSKTGDE